MGCGKDFRPTRPPGERFRSGAAQGPVRCPEGAVYVEPRVIVRPACPPRELLGQSYSNVRVDVPLGAFRSEQKNSLSSSA
ncbi:hypothetical protein MTP99_009333 [Tenebrio molitor]|nr:hypothetical protein MTP99_009333 [Tenebrio molitor]